jgi:DnaJ-domain-containing protein 1
VVAVELDGAGASLAELLRRERAADDDVLRRSLLRAMASQRLHGEVLIDEFRLSPSVVGLALRKQLLVRLASLEQLADARVCFRVAVRTPRGALQDRPLEPREFLYGRRRARERAVASSNHEDASAWSVLGLSPGADPAAIKQAYRRLARTVHPDLHPQATPEERRHLEVRFSQIHEAYRALVA